MENFPLSLAAQIHPVYGAGIVFAGWFLLQVFSGYRQYKKEQLSGRGPPVGPDGRTPSEVSKDLEIVRITAQRDEDQKRHEAEVDRLNEARGQEQQRHSDEILSMERRLASKLAAVDAAEATLLRVTSDRDRGWDLVRELDEDIHSLRHEANNKIVVAFGAGKMGLDPPEDLPRLPSLSDRAGKRAKENPS